MCVCVRLKVKNFIFKFKPVMGKKNRKKNFPIKSIMMIMIVIEYFPFFLAKSSSSSSFYLFKNLIINQIFFLSKNEFQPKSKARAKTKNFCFLYKSPKIASHFHRFTLVKLFVRLCLCLCVCVCGIYVFYTYY